MRKRLLMSSVLLALAAAGAVVAMTSCSTTWPRRDPLGEVFPSVVGSNLKGDTVRLPEDVAGEPVLLAIGYDQDAQFDLDRWFQALNMATSPQSGLTPLAKPLRAFEVPTIPGWVPSLISGTIDGGMRRGIPEEDWAGVVTVYDDAAKIAEFTGNEEALTGRIVVLDGDGVVAFFHDRGYSMGNLRKMLDVVKSLRK